MAKYKLYVALSISIIGMLLCTSCRPKKITPQSQLHDSVMVIHDEVMPKMKDIYRLRKRLKKKVEQSKSSSDIAEIKSLIAALETADDTMMDWMAAYDKPDEGTQGAMEYLAKEKIRIEKVRDEMLSAIANAKRNLDVQ